MKPTIGRIVHYWPDIDSRTEIVPAIITRVAPENDGTTADLVAFAADAPLGVFARAGVENAPVKPEPGKWSWPPRVPPDRIHAAAPEPETPPVEPPAEPEAPEVEPDSQETPEAPAAPAPEEPKPAEPGA